MEEYLLALIFIWTACGYIAWLVNPKTHLIRNFILGPIALWIRLKEID